MLGDTDKTYVTEIECAIAQLHQSAIDHHFEEAARLLPSILTHPEFKPGINGAAPNPLAPLNGHCNVIVTLQLHILMGLDAFDGSPFSRDIPLLFRHLMDTLSILYDETEKLITTSGRVCGALEVVLCTVCRMFLDCPMRLNTVPGDIQLIIRYFLLISPSTYTGHGVVSVEMIMRVITRVPEMNSCAHDALRAYPHDIVFRGWDYVNQWADLTFREGITDRLPPHVLYTNLMCLEVLTLEPYFGDALAERGAVHVMVLLLKAKLIGRHPSGEEAFRYNLPLKRLSTCVYNMLRAHPPRIVAALDSSAGLLKVLARAVDYLARNPTELPYSWREGWRLPDIVDLIEQEIIQGNGTVLEIVRYRMDSIRTLGLGCVTAPGIEKEHRMVKAWMRLQEALGESSRG